MTTETRDIHVVLASDDGYAHAVATTALSIAEHTSSRVLITVLSDGISEENKNKITSSVPQKNIKIEFISIDLEKTFPGFKSSGRITRSTYSRFLIPKLFREESKVIYADVDAIFTGNIQELYNEDLTNHIIAAVPEDFHTLSEREDFKKRLGLSLDHTYFCAGLLLINCKAWNQQKISDLIIQTEEKFRNRLTMADQDLLNIVFQNKYKQLPKIYNAINQFSKDLYIYGDPQKIIFRHFNGKLKPWISYPCRLYGAEKYWDVASRTVYYPELKAKAHKLPRLKQVVWKFRLATIHFRKIVDRK